MSSGARTKLETADVYGLVPMEVHAEPRHPARCAAAVVLTLAAVVVLLGSLVLIGLAFAHINYQLIDSGIASDHSPQVTPGTTPTADTTSTPVLSDNHISLRAENREKEHGRLKLDEEKLITEYKHEERGYRKTTKEISWWKGLMGGVANLKTELEHQLAATQMALQRMRIADIARRIDTLSERASKRKEAQRILKSLRPSLRKEERREAESAAKKAIGSLARDNTESHKRRILNADVGKFGAVYSGRRPADGGSHSHKHHPDRFSLKDASRDIDEALREDSLENIV